MELVRLQQLLAARTLLNTVRTTSTHRIINIISRGRSKPRLVSGLWKDPPLRYVRHCVFIVIMVKIKLSSSFVKAITSYRGATEHNQCPTLSQKVARKHIRGEIKHEALSQVL